MMRADNGMSDRQVGAMRFACDTGGTFTDLITESRDGVVNMYKAPTRPDDPVEGVVHVLRIAAHDHGETLPNFLSRGELFIHGTTHAINAIVTNKVAKTAFLTTEGHPDILLLREGGRIEPFNFRVPYPRPYIPRALTFEISERIASSGEVVKPLDEHHVRDTLRRLGAEKIEAVAVCLLWSILNPVHEERLGELLDEMLPSVPYTLSHRLNPALREYRRASSAAIDASLKPLMSRYLGGLEERLKDVGFSGRTLVVTSQGGIMDADELARMPIHAINSGPSMAPLAGRVYAGMDSTAPDIIVADTGGTTFDVSLVRRGRIPITRETWIGQPFRGHMTGFPSIDIKSVGAGGGSIARVDSGGILHVGPESAGSVPGPVCYGAGGSEPTLTDACVVLGYVDPDFFLGGTMKLDVASAERALEEKVAMPLGLELNEAAVAVVGVATENMVQAISEITVNQGIDPADAVLVGGGGAAGFNSVFIARRLGCPTVIIPETGAALSAAGGLISDLRKEFRAMHFTTSTDFDAEGVERVLKDLEAQCRHFARTAGKGTTRVDIAFAVDARYASQVWEIDVPVRWRSFKSQQTVTALAEDFHKEHEEIFAVRDPESAIEFVTWSASVSCRLREDGLGRVRQLGAGGNIGTRRRVYFEDTGEVEVPILAPESLKPDTDVKGPAIIESPFTTIVVDPTARFRMSESGSIVITP
jgi:N-methylhydantoinase A